jgi:cold-inducible RNA-binding protein
MATTTNPDSIAESSANDLHMTRLSALSEAAAAGVFSVGDSPRTPTAASLQTSQQPPPTPSTTSITTTTTTSLSHTPVYSAALMNLLTLHRSNATSMNNNTNDSQASTEALESSSLNVSCTTAAAIFENRTSGLFLKASGSSIASTGASAGALHMEKPDQQQHQQQHGTRCEDVSRGADEDAFDDDDDDFSLMSNTKNSSSAATLGTSQQPGCLPDEATTIQGVATGQLPSSSAQAHQRTMWCPDPRRLLVANLPTYVTAADLLLVFSRYGAVESVKLVYNQRTGRCRGFAFLKFSSLEDSDKAVEGMHGSMYGDRIITVRPATIRVKEGGGGALSNISSSPSSSSHHLRSTMIGGDMISSSNGGTPLYPTMLIEVGKTEGGLGSSSTMQLFSQPLSQPPLPPSYYQPNRPQQQHQSNFLAAALPATPPLASSLSSSAPDYPGLPLLQHQQPHHIHCHPYYHAPPPGTLGVLTVSTTQQQTSMMITPQYAQQLHTPQQQTLQVTAHHTPPHQLLYPQQQQQQQQQPPCHQVVYSHCPHQQQQEQLFTVNQPPQQHYYQPPYATSSPHVMVLQQHPPQHQGGATPLFYAATPQHSTPPVVYRAA